MEGLFNLSQNLPIDLIPGLAMNLKPEVLSDLAILELAPGLMPNFTPDEAAGGFQFSKHLYELLLVLVGRLGLRLGPKFDL